MSMPSATLDEATREDIASFFSELFGWVVWPNDKEPRSTSVPSDTGTRTPPVRIIDKKVTNYGSARGYDIDLITIYVGFILPMMIEVQYYKMTRGLTRSGPVSPPRAAGASPAGAASP